MNINFANEDEFDRLDFGDGVEIEIEVKKDDHDLVTVTFRGDASTYILVDVPCSELLRLAQKLTTYLDRSG